MSQRIEFQDDNGQFCSFDPAKAKTWQNEVTWDGEWEKVFFLPGGVWIKQWHREGDFRDKDGQPTSPPNKVTKITADDALGRFHREGLPYPEELLPLLETRNLDTVSIQETETSGKRGRGAAGKTGGQIEIARWSELGIGVEAKDHYVAFSPCPPFGAVVHPTKQPRLHLAGKRWYEVLRCLAESQDGKTANKNELVTCLGYLKRGKTSDEQARYEERLEQAKKIASKLTSMMSDLGRQLREQVRASDKTPAFESFDRDYRAAFATACLLRDDQDHMRFGESK